MDLFSAVVVAQRRRVLPQLSLYVIVAFNSRDNYWGIPSACQRYYTDRAVAEKDAQQLPVVWTDWRIFEIKETDNAAS